MEHEYVKTLLDAGVGSAMALLMVLLIYRIVRSLGESFIEAQQRQATALAEQARSVAGLSESVRDFISKDNTEHREMLVLLR